VLLARRHGRRWPAFAVLCAARLAYETLGVVVAEDDRAAKLRALAAGALAGLRGDAAAPQAASA